MGTAIRIDERSAQDGECCGRASEARGDAYEWFVDHAKQCGRMTSGHHNLNFLMPILHGDLAEQLGHLPNSPVKVRVPIHDALQVVPRTWRHEARLLFALQDCVPNVPALLKGGRASSVHVYVDGVTLSTVCPPEKWVDDVYIQALTDLFGVLAQVRREDLPPLPLRWPRTGDSSGYLRRLARLTDACVRRPNWGRFGTLLASLGVPPNTMRAYAERVPGMQPRPYALLHTDLHRDNLIVTGDPARPLFFLDWELASYGDPLHDLATHLVRMRYPDDQQSDVIEAWRDVMHSVRPEAATGLDTDLPRYIAFEHAQSVYPDVMRAATRLLGDLDVNNLDTQVGAVRHALLKAQKPLGLRPVDGRKEIRAALLDWRRDQMRIRGGREALRKWRRGRF
ncbi:phosphotransferase family protein [Streptomyces sp. NBC_01262]|uniref:phosphotransferase family protein n=1 Tax=Streptomyces sp. NBC_01262 TaxID=2903803 RepID=UPI002E323778|nr:phosphotransferase [Streptomyces sp. NBC_01262]